MPSWGLFVIWSIILATSFGLGAWLRLRQKPKPPPSPTHTESYNYRTLLINLAHDRTTPMHTIELLLENISLYSIESDEARWRQSIERMREQVAYLKKLNIEERLLAKLDEPTAPITRTAVDMRELAEKVLTSLQDQASVHGIQLQYQGLPAPPLISADATQMHRVLANLIENGIKYTHKRHQMTHEGVVTLNLASEKRQLIIKISDNGMGMNQDNLQYLWDTPFQSRDARNINIEGTGLGMTILKRIIEQHKGTIDVWSQVGEGTIFTIKLPQQ